MIFLACAQARPVYASDAAVPAAPAPISVAPSAAPADPSDAIRPATEGFYPIWENTGFVEKRREMYIGTNGAHYGIADVLLVGIGPDQLSLPRAQRLRQVLALPAAAMACRRSGAASTIS